jgi:hypothetical protein
MPRPTHVLQVLDSHTFCDILQKPTVYWNAFPVNRRVAGSQRVRESVNQLPEGERELSLVKLSACFSARVPATDTHENPAKKCNKSKTPVHC